jgi:central glycolytic genes regulator
MQLFTAMKKLLPEFIEVMHQRYHILRYVRLMQPIGRRSLALNMSLTERVLRREVDLLKDEGLVTISSKGMMITNVGEAVLLQLEEIVKETSGLKELEKQLKDKLNVKEVILVSGNSDEEEWVKRELGSACARQIRRHLADENIIAVTGGTTMAAAAEMMKPDNKGRNQLFVPARGGLGERVENEANTICAKMAMNAHGQYRLLHVPDEVSEETYHMITEEPSVKEVHSLIKSANIVVHGIGNANKMAARRKSSPSIIKKLERGQAIGEAFGYYFDDEGHIIHRVNTIGLQLEDLNNEKCMIAVAGGSTKAASIKAYIQKGNSDILITDEGAAKKLLTI